MEENVEVPQTKLSLFDLIVWVTCCGLFCGLRFWRDDPDLPERVRTAQLIFFVSHLLVYPIGIAALVHFARRWLTRQPIDFQPGHWLLCLIGTMGFYYLLSSPTIMIVSWLEEVNGVDTFPYRNWMMGLSQFLYIGVYLAAGFLMPVAAIWRLALIPKSLVCLIVGITILGITLGVNFHQYGVFTWMQPLLLGSEMILITLLAIVDTVKCPRPRDGLHWLGVLVAIFVSAPHLVVWIGQEIGVL